MPAVSVHVPKYCLHKARGLAYVRDHGKVRYLGKHGSSESKEAYGRFLIEWQARRVGVPLPLPKSSADLMVVELCAAYLDYAEGYYRKNGQPTRSLDNIKLAIRPLKAMYGHELVSEFSPLQLLAIQERLATAKCTRSYVNKQVGALKRMFKWGVSRTLVPPTVYSALATVEGLRMGRSSARESKPVAPVADAVVDDTLPHLPVGNSKQIAAFTVHPRTDQPASRGTIYATAAGWSLGERPVCLLLFPRVRRNLAVGAPRTSSIWLRQSTTRPRLSKNRDGCPGFKRWLTT
jgi:hypothetical protein